MASPSARLAACCTWLPHVPALRLLDMPCSKAGSVARILQFNQHIGAHLRPVLVGAWHTVNAWVICRRIALRDDSNTGQRLNEAQPALGAAAGGDYVVDGKPVGGQLPLALPAHLPLLAGRIFVG